MTDNNSSTSSDELYLDPELLPDEKLVIDWDEMPWTEEKFKNELFTYPRLKFLGLQNVLGSNNANLLLLI